MAITKSELKELIREIVREELASIASPKDNKKEKYAKPAEKKSKAETKESGDDLIFNPGGEYEFKVNWHKLQTILRHIDWVRWFVFKYWKGEGLKKYDKPDESKDAPTIGEHNNNKVLVFNPDENYEFKFGVLKLKTILDSIEDVDAFVESKDE